MVNYREILRLHSLVQSQRTIRSSAHCSDNTVRTVLEVASQKRHLHNFFHDTATALNSSLQHQQVERQLLCLLFRMLLILRIEEPIMRLQKHELLVPKEA